MDELPGVEVVEGGEYLLGDMIEFLNKNRLTSSFKLTLSLRLG